MSLVAEERRIRSLFDRIEAVEEVAETMDEDDERRTTLLNSARGVLAEVDPVRPRIAALLLQLSERTVRAWVAEGVLTQAKAPSRRLLLDPERLHEVMHLVRDLRKAGHDRNLLEALWYRLSDQALLEREDLSESLAQMRRGEGRVLYDPGVDVYAALYALAGSIPPDTEKRTKPPCCTDDGAPPSSDDEVEELARRAAQVRRTRR